MTLEEAISTAIEYETRVRDVYAQARDEATDEVGKRVFKFLAREEQGHLDFLEAKLREWRETGRVSPAGLETAVPPKERIEAGVASLERKMDARDRGDEYKMLEKAHQVEIETGDFYRRMVDEMGAEGKELFRRFVEIEEGHELLVRAEMDAVSGMGFWFDMPEFHLEAE